MVHHGKCPLCKSENSVHHALCRDHLLSREEFELVRCSACGFIFTQDHPDGKESAKYYESDDYISHNDRATGFSNVLYRFSRRIMLRNKKCLISKLTGLKTGTLLDIGSGTGYFLSEMKNAGWNVRGIEINDKARDFSISNFGLEVLDQGSSDNLEPGSFNCITLWHVLEHFQDPFCYASGIKKLLNPEGICIVALPNCSSYDAVHYGNYWAAYDVPRHLWHFTPGTFKMFSEKAGFNVTGIRALPLDAFYISFLSEKYKGSRFPLLSGMFKGLWFTAMSWFRKDRSSSLIYLLKQ